MLGTPVSTVGAGQFAVAATVFEADAVFEAVELLPPLLQATANAANAAKRRHHHARVILLSLSQTSPRQGTSRHGYAGNEEMIVDQESCVASEFGEDVLLVTRFIEYDHAPSFPSPALRYGGISALRQNVESSRPLSNRVNSHLGVIDIPTIDGDRKSDSSCAHLSPSD
jgi:hypothetical protein